MMVLVPIFSVNSRTELEENGSEFIKSEVASILEEPFNRNALPETRQDSSIRMVYTIATKC